MKTPVFLLCIFTFLCQKFESFLPKKHVDYEYLCQILGPLLCIPKRTDEDTYFYSVQENINRAGLKKHVRISKDESDRIFIPEESHYRSTSYKIVIKNLAINIPEDAKLFSPRDQKDESSALFILENNCFYTKGNAAQHFGIYIGEDSYLILKNNQFKSVYLVLYANNVMKIELVDNKHIDCNLEIQFISRLHHDHLGKNWEIIRIKNNYFYRDNSLSRLTIRDMKLDDNSRSADPETNELNIIRAENVTNSRIKCYFTGKNTVDNLDIKLNPEYLYWGGCQNIDPKGQYAHEHKKIFMNLMRQAIDNDKAQEAILRRELTICERALIKREKDWLNYWQDRFILWWSSWISDYGISWFRPIRLLFYINAALAAIVTVYFFEPKYSWWFMFAEFEPEISWCFFFEKWLLLFAEFFNPLSSLSGVTDIKNNGWIASINVAQKVILAVFYYEIIKIFRRFSK